MSGKKSELEEYAAVTYVDEGARFGAVDCCKRWFAARILEKARERFAHFEHGELVQAHLAAIIRELTG